MRRMFLRLTELGEATEDTRRRVPLAELSPEAGEEAAAVIERLARARLLVVGDDSAEIAHEALIREWPRLRGWLAEDREELRTLRAADDGGPLLGRDGTQRRRPLPRSAPGGGGRAGRRRAAALARRTRVPRARAGTRRTRELSDARRRARRLRALLAGVAAALVAALIAGAFALVQRGRARHSATVAQAGRLAAQSREVAAQASRPGAPPRARGRPARRLGRLPRRAPGRARARLADPRVAAGVRLAGQRARRSARTGSSWRPSTQRRHDALGHGDLAPGRAAAAIVAGPLEKASTSAPTGGRSRSRAERAASSCGTWRPGRSCGS